MKLAFYTGPHCHLCDDALAILQASRSWPSLDIEKFNIREDTQLYHLYAVRIPVIKRLDNGEELGWPFDLTRLEQFLK
ncbi:glutaredoxin family protein [Alteromonas aestuariivivens]|uniref:Glutaredoxin family protein n=1 Tax=Alteromonas aestuariivivens TaxID=1938339 RepID=A0A3D8M818_9ALTE|nr:glutaredoxin family protein [Alteromonas aestuariivivens]RDV25964.1 glutaredoxin family protein [Alteromonas aestuariivivens]